MFRSYYEATSSAPAIYRRHRSAVASAAAAATAAAGGESLGERQSTATTMLYVFAEQLAVVLSAKRPLQSTYVLNLVYSICVAVYVCVCVCMWVL